MLEFLFRGTASCPAGARRIAILPGAFNPPTIAHLEMARAAQTRADEVILLLPRSLPHKKFEAAGFADRCAMISLVASTAEGVSAAVCDGGLFLEMAEETQAFYGGQAEIELVCGRDAAERIAAWDYGRPGVFDEMLRRFRLLVAARAGEYRIPAGHEDRVMSLTLNSRSQEVSSTEVRRRIAEGAAWEHLVPPSIVPKVRELYKI